MSTAVLKEFKTQLIIFFDELIDNFPDEGDLVIARLFISTQIPIKDLMDHFNHKINTNDQELRRMVKARRDDFFLYNTLFSSVESNLSHFKKIWRSGRLDDEEKDIIWKWIDTFIFLGDKYTNSLKK